MALMLTLCIFRIYYINASDYLTTASQVQGRYHLNIATARGGIYDRNMEPLVNREHRYLASVLPTPQAANELLRVTPEEKREGMMERLSGGLPFAVEVESDSLYAVGIDVFKVPSRYGEEQYAPHLIGYLGDEGRTGASGIERAYDTLLQDEGGKFYAKYHTDAAGRTMEGGGVEIHRENPDSAGGVVLTLDRQIQLLTQKALASGCQQGAAVVLDAQNGDILAMASLPAFDQNDIAASLDRTDAPFINRAISGYNIGSVFKLVIAAAALESGIPPSYSYECKGYVDISGQIFRCNNHAVHGAIAMNRALQVSCNTYFIHLAQQMEPDYLLLFCRHLGLGDASQLAPGLVTQPGNLPTSRELVSPAALANFSFGQGSSLASPLQIAQVMAAFANGGTSISPRLIRGFTQDGISLSEQNPSFAGGEVLRPETAETVRRLMVSVIEDGSGRTARPLVGGAGGKTSSAQTGIMTGEGEEEKEIVHAWFAGFYPAEHPRYSVVVFVEGGESGEQVAAPIFKAIIDGIGRIDS